MGGTMHETVAIFGSCVSRDIYGEDRAAEVSTYLARSGLASQMMAPVQDAQILTAIASPFQRRMVQADMEKQLWGILEVLEFERLLIHFVDERFSILRVGTKGGLALSAEMNKARETLGLPSPETADLLTPRDSEWQALWLSGWQRLCAALRVQGRFDRLVVNRVFWAEVDIYGAPLNGGNTAYIRRGNAELDRLYQIVDRTEPQVKQLTYPPRMIMADPNHRWGLSAYHYCPEVYSHARDQLSGL